MFVKVLLSFLFSAIVSAKIVELEIYKLPSIGVQPVFRSLDMNKSESQPKEPAMQLSSNYHNNPYLANISVGTPPQHFKVAVHTGSTTVWVFDKVASAEQGYDPAASSTSKLLELPEFFDNSAHTIFRGKTYTDLLDIGGIAIVNQTFGSIVKIEEEEQKFGATGLLGLAWAFDLEKDRHKDEMPILNMISQLDKPIFTLWLERHQKPTDPSHGLITFGAVDEKHCDSANLLYVPATKSEYWMSTFQIDSISVGAFKSEEGKSSTGILDSGLPYIHAEEDAHRSFFKEVNANYDESLSMFTVECSRLAALPTWTFTIGGRQFAVKPEDYLLDLGAEDGKCALAVQHYSSMSFGWTLGGPFLRSYCTVFDVGAGRYGFAEHRKQN